MPTPSRTWRSLILRSIFITAILFCALATFCLSPSDESSLRSFCQAVQRWQTNPEFRSIARDYSITGSNAAAAQLCFIPARKVIIGIRSFPGLPQKYAVSGNSRNHYNAFSRGPLSAYLFLCSEQNFPYAVESFETEAAKNNLSDPEMARLLGTYNMGFPVATDCGACRSMAATFTDSDATSPFLIRQNIAPLLLDPIHQIASNLQIPPDPQAMTFPQQQAVLERLDSYIRAHDFQLWRTKQVSDTAAGIWAQAYGPPYTMIIRPYLLAHDTAKILLIALLAVLIVQHTRRLVSRDAQRSVPKLTDTNL